MHRYIIKRLLFLIPTVLGVTLIIFIVMNITPGNPGRMILGANATAEEVEAMNEELGYNDPVLVRWFNYLKKIVTKGDFGQSYTTKLNVFDELWPRFSITLRLAILVLVLSVCIGVPLGILSAVKQNSLMDTIPTMIAFFLAAVPSFVVGILLMYVFALKLGWFPSFGLKSAKHYVLPVLAATICELSAYLRFTKSSMLESIRQDYVRTARAKGVSEREIVFHHSFRNALIPTVTVIGVQLGGLIGGAVLTETVFAWPGLGRYIVQSVNGRDTPAVMGCIIVLAVGFSLVNLFVDLLYGFIDPRVRSMYR